jgi:hypothetical protein
MSAIQVGYLLSSGTTGFVAGCSVSQPETPALGTLVRVSLDKDYSIYGMITGLHIGDDGMVRQLVTAGNISPEVMRDNRERRIVPLEMAVLAVGFEVDGKISHLLPPRPPLSLDAISLCPESDLKRFIGAGHFGYFRHILRAVDIPVGEVLAAHLLDVKRRTGDVEWVNEATRELITLLRDDYATLMAVLGALGEVF